MFKINAKSVVILIGIAVLLFLIYNNQQQKGEILSADTNFQLLETEKMNNKSQEKKSEKIIIHLSGAVKNPGVYRLNKKERLIDLIEAAGGLKEEANLERINLAESLYDGQKVIIPLIKAKNNQLNSTEDFKAQSDQESLNNYYGSTDDKLVNINQADQSELESLSGIGPAKAAAIIKYREKNDFFDKKEDLLKIGGIGEKTLENLKDEIVVR